MYGNFFNNSGFFLITSICAESITAKEQRASETKGTKANFNPKNHFPFFKIPVPIINFLEKKLGKFSLRQVVLNGKIILELFERTLRDILLKTIRVFFYHMKRLFHWKQQNVCHLETANIFAICKCEKIYLIDLYLKKLFLKVFTFPTRINFWHFEIKKNLPFQMKKKLFI